MKKGLLAAAAAVSLLLTGCGLGGDVSRVEVKKWEPSEIYSDEDINDAIDTVKDYFKDNFDGCTLLTLSYTDDKEEFAEWAEQKEADEAIVLYSSFYVSRNGGDGSLNQDYTYEGWNWILTRDKGDAWRHADHGY